MKLAGGGKLTHPWCACERDMSSPLSISLSKQQSKCRLICSARSLPSPHQDRAKLKPNHLTILGSVEQPTCLFLGGMKKPSLNHRFRICFRSAAPSSCILRQMALGVCITKQDVDQQAAPMALPTSIVSLHLFAPNSYLLGNAFSKLATWSPGLFCSPGHNNVHEPKMSLHTQVATLQMKSTIGTRIAAGGEP